MAGNVAFYRNDNLLEVVGLQDEASGAAIVDAAVAVTVRSLASTPGCGTAVSGQSWPAALAYVAESEGDYRCVLDHDAAFALGQTYEAEISAVAGSGLVATWFFLFTVLARRS